MDERDKKRRNSLLSSIAFTGGHGVVRLLRQDLEDIHFIPATLDRVRADLAWLADVGAVEVDGDLVRLTSEGREHVQRLRDLF